MFKKLTYEFVKSEFEKEGYELLSEEYVNNQTKLKYKCPEGHEHIISWHSWQRGSRCRLCAVDKRASSRRYEIEFIKNSFEKEGYTLLTKEYVNSFQKLEYICPKGHRHSICWNNWQNGCRCPYCSGNAKLSIDFIRNEFKKEKYILLSREYINAHTKLDCRCSEGHEYLISWDKWQQGCRCPVCFNEKRGLSTRLSFDFIRSEFEKENYILLTEEYINNRQKLKYICPKGHKHEISWCKWDSGRRCPTCAIINNSGPNNYNWQGGISCEPYCGVWLDKDFKESIKERDNHQCQNPDCWGTMPEDLTIHHIDYNKKNCRPENLITLCRSCNSRANYSRNYWQRFYSTVLYKKSISTTYIGELKLKMEVGSGE